MDMFDRGFDARDWIRGTKPWDQFLTYCTGLANTKGSRLRAAQLADDRHLADVERQLERQKSLGVAADRPSMDGFTDEVEAIYNLSDDIRLLTRVVAKSNQPTSWPSFRLRPEQPADRVKARKKTYGLAQIARILKGG